MRRLSLLATVSIFFVLTSAAVPTHAAGGGTVATHPGPSSTQISTSGSPYVFCGASCTGGGGCTFPSYTYWKWCGTSRQAWIGQTETDSIGYHRNLEIQPAGGGSVNNNYHIYPRPSSAYYDTWRVVDSVTGTDRTYTESSVNGDEAAAEAAASAFAADVQNDTGISTIYSELLTKHSGDEGNLTDCLYNLLVG